jgi:hypothetical protein
MKTAAIVAAGMLLLLASVFGAYRSGYEDGFIDGKIDAIFHTRRDAAISFLYGQPSTTNSTEKGTPP